MGSASSGPPRTRALAHALRDCLCIHLADLDREGVLDAPDRTATVAGGHRPAIRGWIEARGRPVTMLVLRYVLDEGGQDHAVTQHVPITSTPMPRGGRRRWLLCPRCRARVKILALPPRGRGFGCRRCLGLVAPCRQRAMR